MLRYVLQMSNPVNAISVLPLSYFNDNHGFLVLLNLNEASHLYITLHLPYTP